MAKVCLIVDDSRIVRTVARRIISELGFGTLEAADGKMALEMVSRHQPDVLLLDWNMPIMNGLECLKALRADKTITQPKVIFCTTENDPNHISEAMRHGADEYVMKPFDTDIIRIKFTQVGLLQG